MPTEKAHGLQISKMCESFAKQGVNIKLIIPKRRNTIKEDIFAYYNLKEGFSVKRLFTVDIIGILENSFVFILQSLSFSLAVLLYLKKINYRGVIYSRDPMSLFLLSFCKRFKLFFEVHTFPTKTGHIYKRLFKNIKFVTITKGLKDELIKQGVKEDNILVASDAVDLDLFSKVSGHRQELDLPVDKKIVTYTGKLTTMGKVKGVDFLLSAFKNVLQQVPNTLLLIVGVNKEEKSELENALRALNISKDNYRLVLHTDSQKIPKYQKASDVLVMNYPATKHYSLYMSPLKMFEYMASGTPIVTSDLPSIREVLDDSSALLVKPDDEQSLTAGLVKILSDEELANSLSTKASELIKKYTWQDRVKNILQFIK